jgi:hypothetical protein
MRRVVVDRFMGRPATAPLFGREGAIMTKQKIKHYEPQTVTEAEKVLADLEGKRQKLLTFAQQLTAYAAHVADDLAHSGHPMSTSQCPLLRE